MPGSLLTKSKYLYGIQCPRYLWVACNDPSRIPERDAATQHIFDQGHLVSELAKRLFPVGIDVPTEDFRGNIAMTKRLLNDRRPLFEAGMLCGRVYSRVDILNPVNDDEWDIIEVKSSTSVKEVNLHDVSFQRLCCEDGGLKIRKCFLAHINNQYFRNGAIDPEQLFVLQDVSDEVAAVGEGIRDRSTEMLEVIGAPSCPEMTIGAHCSDPYPCPLTDCWNSLPEHHVFTLYRGSKKSDELYHSGVFSIADIPASCKLNDKQRIQCDCVVSGQPYLDKASVRGFLSSLRYPLYYLDFETISPAVPLFDGTRPYQKIPFQFSLHVQAGPGTGVQHFGYLADGPQDPRPELLEHLHEVIGNEGSVVVYNQAFEESVLTDLGAAFPEYCEWSESVIARIVDLIIPFRNFHYYHPQQKGSASIKSVLPAIAGKGYEGLGIADGETASTAFMNITYGEVSDEEHRKVRGDLIAYCGLDTEGMIRIVERLREIAG